MSKYDFFIAGRWRNRDNIRLVVDVVRRSGRSAYCFIENEYQNRNLQIDVDGDPEAFMRQFESLSQSDPIIRKIFEVDMSAQREADEFILVFPAGIAAHIEAGAAYGMGKKCYAIGEPEKVESLYCIFEKVFESLEDLQKWLDLGK